MQTFPELRDTRVLIVDDDDGMLQMTADTMKSLGYENIRTFAFGATAMAAISEAALAGQPFDVVITDNDMEEKGQGFKVVQTARIGSLSTIIIHTSGKDQENLPQRALDNGADRFLVKPYGRENLKHAIEDSKAEHAGRQKHHD